LALARNTEMKKTKIVATLGPSCTKEEILREMIRSGMNVARINFSHGKHEEHGQRIELVRHIAREEGRVVAILSDIQGPKIRVGKVNNEKPYPIKRGDRLTFTLDDVPGDNGIIALPHPEFVKDIKPDVRLLVDDGKLEFLVRETTPRGVLVEAVLDGVLSSRKGVSAPNAKLTLSAITDKDRADVEFALKMQTEYLAMSFVRSQDDIREMRWLIRHLGGDNVAIIAKIEMREALENIEAIIESCDGIMVARGDLGIETPAEEVPYHQKRIITLCNAASKPVITATQMLDSMNKNPRPTRAEASDVYNAIIDGTDAVMLSNETASGDYPLDALQTMARIALIAESHIPDINAKIKALGKPPSMTELTSDAICQAASEIERTLHPKVIITTTLTGYTTRRMARERPNTPILCLTPSEITYRRMALVWGVEPIIVSQFDTIDEMIRLVVRAAHNHDFVQLNDRIIIIAGVPFGIGGQTNFFKIHNAGEAGELD
jgi:pyruvate kinase